MTTPPDEPGAAAGPGGVAGEPRVALEDPRSAEARALIGALDDYLDGLYPPDANYLLDVESLCAPEVSFFVARLGGMALGCGALRVLDGRTGELKRMYVAPEARGLGIGRAILGAIERRAAQLGLGELKLETGTAQPEALGLYRTAGFRPCAAFAGYRPGPLNLFLAKTLAGGARRH
ncbi:MAG: GNAT family N-acetyltransferase [Steroidobacteraceae bacterium]|jgi:putative acetyltransferase|nr:GNAT family N-acetyltransferase [Steroidobacteraceae bacterium]